MAEVDDDRRKRADDEAPRCIKRKRMRRTPLILAMLDMDHLKHIALAMRSYVDLVYFASACKEFREAALDTYAYWQRHPLKMPFPYPDQELVLDWSTVVTPLYETAQDGRVKTIAPVARIEEACTLHRLDRDEAVVAAAASWVGWRALKYLMTSVEGEVDLLACAVAAASEGCEDNLFCIQRHCFKRRIVDVTQLKATVVAAIRNDQARLFRAQYFTHSYYGGAATQDEYVGRPRDDSIRELVANHAPRAGAWNVWKRFAEGFSAWHAATLAAAAGHIKFLDELEMYLLERRHAGDADAVCGKDTVDAAVDAGQRAVIEWLVVRLFRHSVTRPDAWMSILRYYLMRGEYTRATAVYESVVTRKQWYADHPTPTEVAIRQRRMLDVLTQGCSRAGRVDCLVWCLARGWKPDGTDLACAIAGNKRHAVNWIQARIDVAKVSIQAAYIEAAKHTCTYVWKHHRTTDFVEFNQPSYAWLMWLVERYPPAVRTAYSQAAIVVAVNRGSANGSAVCLWLEQNGFPTFENAMRHLHPYRVY